MQADKCKKPAGSIICLAVSTFLLMTLQVQGSGAGPEWIPLFDGKTLEGWHVACVDEDRGKDFWRVAEGTIQCNSMGHPDHDYFWLVSDAEYGDFELKLRFRVFRDNKGNSGVQVRSRYDRSPDAPNGGWLDGPQVDINPAGPWRNGLVYDETRGARGWIFPYRPDSGIRSELVQHEVVFKYSDQGDGWNDMIITCRGTRIKTEVNGITVCDRDFDGIINDAEHARRNVGMRGHIALQLHRKGEVNIRFKELYIKELNPNSKD